MWQFSLTPKKAALADMKVLTTLWCVLSAAGPAAAPEAKPKPTPAYEPTSSYTIHEIEGFKVYVHRRLLTSDKALGDEALKLLGMKLYGITRVVPARALARLREVPMWLELANPKQRNACYHPSRRWLEGHDYNPEKARCVEFGNARSFLRSTKHQPMMVLHELAHGYHHRVLTHQNPDILAAYKRAKDSKTYDNVLVWNGRRGRAYAMTNQMEYFAETTEAYFGTNDVYPFVRAELKQHDPQMFKALTKVWNR